MGALTYIKESKIGRIMRETIGGAWGAISEMVNLEEIDDVEEAIEMTKKECDPTEWKELNSFGEIAELTEQVLEEMAEKQFAISDSEISNPEKDENSFEEIAKETKQILKEFDEERLATVDSEKDKDGYNKIQNRLGDIKATVSEEEATKNIKERQKGGKQKTRVDED